MHRAADALEWTFRAFTRPGAAPRSLPRWSGAVGIAAVFALLLTSVAGRTVAAGVAMLLADLGIGTPAARLITSQGDLAGAAAELTAPFVLKAGWLEHKSEHRGIALGLD